MASEITSARRPRRILNDSRMKVWSRARVRCPELRNPGSRREVGGLARSWHCGRLSGRRQVQMCHEEQLSGRLMPVLAAISASCFAMSAKYDVTLLGMHASISCDGLCTQLMITYVSRLWEGRSQGPRMCASPSLRCGSCIRLKRLNASRARVLQTPADPPHSPNDAHRLDHRDLFLVRKVLSIVRPHDELRAAAPEAFH